MLNGVVGGYQVIDAHVDIVDGSYHDVDSNEMAFKLAAIFAVKDAFKKAKPILLEPIMVGHKLGEFSPTRVFKKHGSHTAKVTK